MKAVNISVFKQKKAEKPMRNILGMNNLPKISRKKSFAREKEYYDALHPGHIRFHDAQIENPTQRIVDIHSLFPLFHADETKEENYTFQQTDDYMQSIVGCDAEIDFRLGETIDHSGFERLVAAPTDIDKWARICRNIIGHYKNGEMHGMHLNIKRVSVWEEPDNHCLFGGTVEQYAEMFCKVYRLLKKDFPDIRVGGPSVMGCGYEFAEKFLHICKENGIEPDFVSATCYWREIDIACEQVENYRKIMDKAGLYDTKYVLTEWHFGVPDWSRTGYMSENQFNTVHNAAFSAGLLTKLMDIDYLDVAYYYSWGCSVWAVYDMLSEDLHLMPVYYGLMLFQNVAAECKTRLYTECDEEKNTYVLAGKTEDGKTRLLLTCFGNEDCIYRIKTEGAAKAVLKSVEEAFAEEKCTIGTEIEAKEGVFTIENLGGNGVYLLEF